MISAIFTLTRIFHFTRYINDGHANIGHLLEPGTSVCRILATESKPDEETGKFLFMTDSRRRNWSYVTTSYVEMSVVVMILSRDWTWACKCFVISSLSIRNHIIEWVLLHNLFSIQQTTVSLIICMRLSMYTAPTATVYIQSKVIVLSCSRSDLSIRGQKGVNYAYQRRTETGFFRDVVSSFCNAQFSYQGKNSLDII